ncbi:DUF3169 family protein [Amphibacillus sediminis]|uniref:DUF3169 family protein n=1 Tax=Amphibacillus sediminis TaxID=360185 RepID=UPI00082BBBFA|nr:DUF3169 family protein [Amphibacillus sediminis]
MNKGDVWKMLLLMLGGGLVGGGIAWFGLSIEYIDQIAILWESLIRYTFWLQLFLIVTLLLPVLVIIRSAAKLLTQVDKSVDIEDDHADKQFNKKLFLALTLNRLYMVLSFIIFGIAVDDRNPMIIGSMILFVIFSFLSGLNDVKIVRIMQAHDPRVKGDPTSFKYKKQLLESFDEAEQLQVYKAAYHTFRNMEVCLIIVFVLAIFVKSRFGIGNVAMILIGSIWLIQSIFYLYYSKKFNTFI